MAKLKPVGDKLKGTGLGALLQSKLAVILSNWAFQGSRQMNCYEIALKLLLDVCLAIGFALLLYGSIAISVSAVAVSFVLAHTLNWLFNGHIYVLLRYVRPVPQSIDRFEIFIQEMGRRGMSYKCIDGIAIFGSYCRGSLNENSDLDVRIVVKPGILNGAAGAWCCLIERVTAFVQMFPLDIYCVIQLDGLQKLRSDEVPVVLFARSNLLWKKYPTAKRTKIGVDEKFR